MHKIINISKLETNRLINIGAPKEDFENLKQKTIGLIKPYLEQICKFELQFDIIAMPLKFDTNGAIAIEPIYQNEMFKSASS